MSDTISYFVTGNADALEQKILAAYKRGETLFNKGFQLNVKGGRPLGNINGQLSEFQKSLEASNARVLAFGASTTVLYSLGRGFKALLSDMTNVEKKLNEIQSIFQTTTSGMKTLSSGLFQIAQETSQSFDQVSKAAVEFARQGLSVEKTLEATRAALILSRVANYDAASAVDALTAAVNTYADSGLSHIDIVNKMVAVDTAFAISASGIAEGLKRAGAVAADAGVDFDHLSAAITSVQQITARGASVIGNGLKTIFTRLQREDTRKVLEDIGVATSNTDGSFRDSISVLNDLSDKYVKLSDSQKAYVSQNVAGVYQINTFKALLSSLRGEFGLYDQVLQKSTDASNEALTKNDFLNETFSSLLDRTRASITEFNSYVGEKAFSPPLKDITSKMKDLVDSLNKTAQGKGAFGETGKFIGDSILNGIKDTIAGPGLILLTSLLIRTFQQTAKQSYDAFKTVSGLSSAKQQQLDIETKIQAVLANSDKSIVDQLVHTDSLIKKKQILNQLVDAQLLGEQKRASILSSLGNVVGAKQVKGLLATRKNAASGYLPSLMKEKADISNGIGGARPTAKPLLKKIRNKNGFESVVVNSDEYIVRNFLGSKEDAVFNRDMVLGIGGADRLKTLGDVEHAASGKLPDGGALEREALALSILRNNPSISATKLASLAKIGKAKANSLVKSERARPSEVINALPDRPNPNAVRISVDYSAQKKSLSVANIAQKIQQSNLGAAPSVDSLEQQISLNRQKKSEAEALRNKLYSDLQGGKLPKQPPLHSVISSVYGSNPPFRSSSLSPLPLLKKGLAPLPLQPQPKIIPQRLPNQSSGFIDPRGKRSFSLGPLGTNGSIINTNGLSEEDSYIRNYLHKQAPNLPSGVSKILTRTSGDPASAQSTKILSALANKYLPSVQTLYDKTIALGVETEDLARAFGDASDKSKSEAERLRARVKLTKQVDEAETKIIKRKNIEEKRQQRVLNSGSILDALPGAGGFVSKRVKAAGFTGEAAKQAKEDIIQNQKNKYNQGAGSLALFGAFGVPLIGGVIETAIEKSSLNDESKLKGETLTSSITQAVGSSLAFASLGPVGAAIGVLTGSVQIANAAYIASRDNIEYLSKAASNASASLQEQSAIVDKIPNLEEQLKEAISLGKGSLAIKLQSEIEKAFSSVSDSELSSLIQRRSFASSEDSRLEIDKKIQSRKDYLQRDVDAKTFAAELESAIQETSSLFDNKVNLSDDTLNRLSKALVDNSNASEFLKYLDELRSNESGKGLLDNIGLVRLLSENQNLGLRQKDLDKLFASRDEKNQPIELSIAKVVEEDLRKKAKREQLGSISFNLSSVNLKIDKTISEFTDSINKEFKKRAEKEFRDLDFSLIGLNDRTSDAELSPARKAEIDFQKSRIEIQRNQAEKFLPVKEELTNLLKSSYKGDYQKAPNVLKILEDINNSNGEDSKIFFKAIDAINNSTTDEEIQSRLDDLLSTLDKINLDGSQSLKEAQEIRKLAAERGLREQRNAALLNSGKSFDNFDPKTLLEETIKGVQANNFSREDQIKKRRDLVNKYGSRSSQVSSFDQQQKLFELEQVRARREFRGKEQAFAEPSDSDIENFKKSALQDAQIKADRYNIVSRKYNEAYRLENDAVGKESGYLTYFQQNPSEILRVELDKAKKERRKREEDRRKIGRDLVMANEDLGENFEYEYNKKYTSSPYATVKPNAIKSYSPITGDESKLRDYNEFESLRKKETEITARIAKLKESDKDLSDKLNSDFVSVTSRMRQIKLRNPDIENGIPRDKAVNLEDNEAIREYLRNRNLDKIRRSDSKDSAFELNYAKNITASGIYSARSADIQQKAGKNSNLDFRIQRENPIISQLIDQGNIPGAINRLRDVQGDYRNSKQRGDIDQLINDLTRVSNQKELTPEQSKLLSKDRFGEVSNVEKEKALVDEAQKTHLPKITEILNLLKSSGNFEKRTPETFDVEALRKKIEISDRLNSSGRKFAEKDAAIGVATKQADNLSKSIKEKARDAAFEEFKRYPNKRPDNEESREAFKNYVSIPSKQEIMDSVSGNLSEEEYQAKKYQEFLLGPPASGRQQSGVDLEKRFNEKYKGEIPLTVKNDPEYTQLKNLLEETRKAIQERDTAAKSYNEASKELKSDAKIEVKETNKLPGEEIITSSIKNGIESATLALQNKINVEVNINSGDLKDVISEAIIGFYRSQNGGRAPAVLPSNFEKASRTV